MQRDVVTTDSILNALNQGEFEAYIQSIVRTSDLTVSGGELLVRWHTPTGKVIPPFYFIDQIESAGLLSVMTQNILQQAVTGLSCMAHMLPQGFQLAVNVTPALLADRVFTGMCLRLSGGYGIHLVLELTERHPFSVDKQTKQELVRLNDAGVKFALDDFGTGCSALSYLKHFPVSYIKMDKSFIQDILQEEASRHIVECVITLAEKLGIQSVAEGVETLEQAYCLQSLGVNFFQGYYFGKPVQVKSYGMGGLISHDNRLTKWI